MPIASKSVPHRAPIFAVDCGAPSLTNADFSACTDHTHRTTCSATCGGGTSGTPSAVCGSDGAWAYAGSCTPGTRILWHGHVQDSHSICVYPIVLRSEGGGEGLHFKGV